MPPAAIAGVRARRCRCINIRPCRLLSRTAIGITNGAEALITAHRAVMVPVLTRPAVRSSRTPNGRYVARRCSKITRIMPRLVRWALGSVSLAARTGWHGRPRFEASPSFLPSGTCSPDLDGWPWRVCKPARMPCTDTDTDTGCPAVSLSFGGFVQYPGSHRQAASHGALPGRARERVILLP
jgi:hypothetical protein